MIPTATTEPTDINLSEFKWLTSQTASHWLAELAESTIPLHSLAATLRQELSGPQTHLLLQQAELRRRGAAKFTRSAQMLFTAQGLEQATDEWISRYKAQRFTNQRHVADLCCGIGGDLIGLAEVTTATGVDRCEVATICANHNADVYRSTSSGMHRLKRTVVSASEVAEYSAWHIDPDRRPHGHRTTRVELHEPNLETIEQMIARQRNAAIKLAPASNLPESTGWADRAEFEWISHGGECRQLVAWCGELASHAGLRRATNVGKLDVASFLGTRDIPLKPAARVDRYLFEPDPAVLAAHLTGAVAAHHGLASISQGVAYLTGPRLVVEPLLASFEIIDSLPFDRRKLALYLRARNVGRIEIKHRGVTLDPHRLRAEMKIRGDSASTLIITKIRGRATVLVAQRIESQGVT